MNSETKVLFGILGTTLAIIAAAVLFLGKPTTPTTQPKVANSAILIRTDSQKVSSPSATVTLVEFGDYQCPACGVYHPLVKKLVEEFSDKLTFYFRNFPLSQHKNALISAYAAESAGNQGKFWEMYDLIYQNQTVWSDSGSSKDIFIEYAKDLKLNLELFKKDLDSDQTKQKVSRDSQDGLALGVNSTPTFFLNGEKLDNPRSYDEFKSLLITAVSKIPISLSPTK